jgi:hypothetical protein
MGLSTGYRLGPYEIVSPLGAEGMGEVYKARDTRLERTVAVKVLPSHLAASVDVRQRFEREAKTISQLSHPHICALYDVGSQGETEYLVMELLEGETLSDRLAKGPLALEQTLRYGTEIADALDKAHRQGIVHRDLKPANVMITKSGVKLLDFGLAKAMAPVSPQSSLTALPTQQGLTQEGTILGTFLYMAPEQLEGKDADARTDIFAFGAVLYEMATGKKAFSAASQASLITAIMSSDPPSISSIQPMSPPLLDRVVKKCLAKDAEDRWQNAADLGSELKWIGEAGSQSGVGAPVLASRGRSLRLSWIAAGVFAIAAAASREMKPERGKMKLRRWVVCFCLMGIALSGAAARAQDDVAARIAGAALTRGGASAFLETLTDTVGGRVTGSPQNRAASELILAALKQAGYANARFEEYPMEARWQRGPASGRIVAPIDRAIVVGSYAWVPGTASEITGPLVDLGTPTSADWMPPAERVRGAAVLIDPQKIGNDPAFVSRSGLAKKLAAAGAAAMLLPSDKPGRMVYTSAFGFYPRGPLPVISVAKEDALLLQRLLAKGPVKLALDVRNTFDTAPYKERNVIADLPGASADDVVLVGAHFDSWDPAQGADDDGSGVAAVLEVARILKSLNLTPKRTIRFAFFSGEEEACLGSRAYVTMHEKELDRLSAVLVMDSGAGKPRGVELHGRADLEPAVKQALAPLASFNATGTTLDASFDRDHAPFMVVGVPALTLWVEPGTYDDHHHTVIDTFDKVDPHWLAVDTAVVGIAAWGLANSAGPIGRRLSPAEAAELLKTSGVASTKQMVYGASAR